MNPKQQIMTALIATGALLQGDALREFEQSVDAALEELRSALRPFAECAAQIPADESNEEWAKFRLLVKDFRRAAHVMGAT